MGQWVKCVSKYDPLSTLLAPTAYNSTYAMAAMPILLLQLNELIHYADIGSYTTVLHVEV